ncbi:MAG: hypothetical protein QG653_508 [Patescibacteria group bacterium]|nr:hypothetical protein [Patescibacteria group bacterium]
MNEKEEKPSDEEKKPGQEKPVTEKEEHVCCGIKMRKVVLPDGSETFV